MCFTSSCSCFNFLHWGSTSVNDKLCDVVINSSVISTVEMCCQASVAVILLRLWLTILPNIEVCTYEPIGRLNLLIREFREYIEAP